MAINGRISVDAVFHDTDGTASLKVVSLRSSDEYTTGKVAIVTGTIATSVFSVLTNPTTYKDAAGQPVSFANVQRVICRASRPCNFGDGGTDCVAQTLCMFESSGQPNIDIVPNYTSGTASYTIVFYGT